MKVLILGATGLVGQNTLMQAVTHPAITQVIAPTRTPLPPSSNLANPVAERLELLLPEVLTWGIDSIRSSGLCLAASVCEARSSTRSRSVRPCLGDWCRRHYLILLSEDQGRGRERHEARWLQIADDPPAQHHRRKARRVAFCRRTCSDAVPNTGASSPENVPCQSRSEDSRRSSRQRHCCGPGLSLSLRRKFDLFLWRDVHEIAFDADGYNVSRNSHTTEGRNGHG